MSEALSTNWMTGEQDQRISEAFGLERARLRNFIRKRVADENDVENILQDAFYELVEAYRMMKPVEQVGAWLFQVARNRITDLFRKKRPEALGNEPVGYEEDGESLLLQDLLPSPDAGPEEAYARSVLLEELDAALAEALCGGTPAPAPPGHLRRGYENVRTEKMKRKWMLRGLKVALFVTL